MAHRDVGPRPPGRAPAEFVPAQLPYKAGPAPARAAGASRKLLNGVFNPPAATAHARAAPESGAPDFPVARWSNPHPAPRPPRGRSQGSPGSRNTWLLISGQPRGSREADATIPCLSGLHVCRHHFT